MLKLVEKSKVSEGYKTIPSSITHLFSMNQEDVFVLDDSNGTVQNITQFTERQIKNIIKDNFNEDITDSDIFNSLKKDFFHYNTSSKYLVMMLGLDRRFLDYYEEVIHHDHILGIKEFVDLLFNSLPYDLEDSKMIIDIVVDKINALDLIFSLEEKEDIMQYIFEHDKTNMISINTLYYILRILNFTGILNDKVLEINEFVFGAYRNIYCKDYIDLNAFRDFLFINRNDRLRLATSSFKTRILLRLFTNQFIISTEKSNPEFLEKTRSLSLNIMRSFFNLGLFKASDIANALKILYKEDIDITDTAKYFIEKELYLIIDKVNRNRIANLFIKNKECIERQFDSIDELIETYSDKDKKYYREYIQEKQ